MAITKKPARTAARKQAPAAKPRPAAPQATVGVPFVSVDGSELFRMELPAVPRAGERVYVRDGDGYDDQTLYEVVEVRHRLDHPSYRGTRPRAPSVELKVKFIS